MSCLFLPYNNLKVKVLAAQSCLTFCNPMDCIPPGAFVHGILQARILEWVPIPFSKGSSLPRYGTQVHCMVGRFFNLSHRGSLSRLLTICYTLNVSS